MEPSGGQTQLAPVERIAVRQVRREDVRAALAEGFRDFRRRPLFSAFFGLVYALFGIVVVAGLTVFKTIWMIIPVGVGFPLVAPFLAAGLYEMSRRYERGEDFGWSDIFLVIFRQQRREFGWMAFVMLFVFWVWIYQVRTLLAIFLQWKSFSSFDRFLSVLGTPDGMMFLGFGTVEGAFIATVLFTLTVISMPLLLHREIDFVSAMITSVRTVTASPVVMLGWGFFIAVTVMLAMLPAFLGLIVWLPVLGHATWRLYRRAIVEVEAEPGAG